MESQLALLLQTAFVQKSAIESWLFFIHHRTRYNGT